MPKKGYRSFSKDELKRLRKLYASKTLTDAAKEMGISRNAACWQMHQMGVTKKYSQILRMHRVKLSPCEIGYLAGLIDGEGSISVRRWGGKLKLDIRITSTTRAVMDWLSEKVNMPGAYVETRTLKEGHSIVYIFHIMGLKNILLYRRLLRHLVIKRPHMEAAISYCQERLNQAKADKPTSRQLEAMNKIRALNIKPSQQFLAA